MLKKRVGFVLLAIAFLLAGCGPDPDTWIQEIETSPDRYWNTSIVVEGRVIEAVPEPRGTREGYYFLQDESSPRGIAIRTGELPSPGENIRVAGLVQQDPANPGTTIIRENSRYTNHDQQLLWAGGAAVALGAILLGLLFTLFIRSGSRRSRRARPAMATSGGSAWASGGDAGGAPAWATAGGGAAGGPATSADRTRAFDDATKTFDLYGFFKVQSGPDAPAEFPLGGSPVLVGRGGGRENQVELTDETVSREQARILKDRENGRVMLINESLTNRTKVNGAPVDSAALSPGDEIRMGATVMEFQPAR